MGTFRGRTKLIDLPDGALITLPSPTFRHPPPTLIQSRHGKDDYRAAASIDKTLYLDGDFCGIRIRMVQLDLGAGSHTPVCGEP